MPHPDAHLPAAPALMTLSQGTPQSTQVMTDFAEELEVLVQDRYETPVPGVAVQFDVPATDASATLDIYAPETDADGLARVIATANQKLGTYEVFARLEVEEPQEEGGLDGHGPPGPTITAEIPFELTNLVGTPFRSEAPPFQR